jgi:cobalt-zinc-cadmium efflux system outer membrane protein
MKKPSILPFLKPISDRFLGVVLLVLHVPFSSSNRPTANRFCGKGWISIIAMLCALTVWFPETVQAQTERMASINMEEALTKTLLQHPELPGYQELLRSVDGNIQQAGVGERPELSFLVEDAFGSGDFNGIDNTQATLSLSWLLDGELLDKRTIAARSQKNIFIAKQEVKRLDIAAKTARYYLTALFFQRKKQLELDAITQLERVQSEVAKRVKAGAAPDADLYRAQANLAEKKLVLNDVDYEIDSAMQNLAAQWGEYQPDFATVQGSLDVPEQPVNLFAIRERLADNPNVQLFLSEERLAQSKIDVARAEAKALWRFNAGVRRYEATNDYGVVAGFSVPLGSRDRNKGKVIALSAEQAASRANAEAVRIRMEAQLANYVRSFERYQDSEAALKQDIIPRIERALMEAEKAYKLGKYSFEEWSSAQRELLAAKATLLDLQFKAHLNRVEIERLAGVAI